MTNDSVVRIPRGERDEFGRPLKGARDKSLSIKSGTPKDTKEFKVRDPKERFESKKTGMFLTSEGQAGEGMKISGGSRLHESFYTKDKEGKLVAKPLEGPPPGVTPWYVKQSLERGDTQRAQYYAKEIVESERLVAKREGRRPRYSKAVGELYTGYKQLSKQREAATAKARKEYFDSQNKLKNLVKVDTGFSSELPMFGDVNVTNQSFSRNGSSKKNGNDVVGVNGSSNKNTTWIKSIQTNPTTTSITSKYTPSTTKLKATDDYLGVFLGKNKSKSNKNKSILF